MFQAGFWLGYKAQAALSGGWIVFHPESEAVIVLELLTVLWSSLTWRKELSKVGFFLEA